MYALVLRPIGKQVFADQFILPTSDSLLEKISVNLLAAVKLVFLEHVLEDGEMKAVGVE